MWPTKRQLTWEVVANPSNHSLSTQKAKSSLLDSRPLVKRPRMFEATGQVIGEVIGEAINEVIRPACLSAVLSKK